MLANLIVGKVSNDTQDGAAGADVAPGIVVSLDTLVDTGALGFCASCHPSASEPDLKNAATVAKAIAQYQLAVDKVNPLYA